MRKGAHRSGTTMPTVQTNAKKNLRKRILHLSILMLGGRVKLSGLGPGLCFKDPTFRGRGARSASFENKSLVSACSGSFLALGEYGDNSRQAPLKEGRGQRPTATEFRLQFNLHPDNNLGLDRNLNPVPDLDNQVTCPSSQTP